MNAMVITTKVSNCFKVALIRREHKWDPWIVAFGYNESDRTWMSGHYFSSFESAAKFYIETYKVDEEEEE